MDIGDWLIFKQETKSDSTPEEVTIVFPENKPEDQEKKWKIVQNMNENEEIPEESDLLSDHNSQARNEQVTEQIGTDPYSEGNADIQNLSPMPSKAQKSNFQKKRFSSKALTGDSYQAPRSPQEESTGETTSFMTRSGSNNMMQQKEFSANELGPLSLSTYQWEYAPYINALKNKLYHVWFAPAAYSQMGLIHGYTIIRFTIARDGTLIDKKVLKHEGHGSLQTSSSNAIQSLFPFRALPDKFPEDKLIITIKLIYPDLRSRR